MPGGLSKHSLELPQLFARRNRSALTAHLIRAGTLVLCLGLACTARLYAADAVPAPLDPEDKVSTGVLNPSADAKSRANALYAQALQDGPGDSPQKAMDELREVAALDPHFADAQVRLANLLLQSGQVDSALTQLTTAAAANPDSLDIQSALGLTQRLRGQNDEALRLSKAVLSKDPTQTTAMRVLLEVAADQNDLASAVLHIEDILKNAGLKAPASVWLTLARIYLEVGHNALNQPNEDVVLKTLLPIYQAAADKSPAEVEALTLLSDTFRNLGRKKDALKALQQASALEPSNVDILLRCGDLESALNQKNAALRDYESAYTLNPGLTGLREMLGRLYLDGERYTDATRLLQDALNESPNDPSLVIDLGIAYEGAHQPEQAQACFQRIFSLVTCPPEAYLKLAVFQFQHKEVKQAHETLATAQAHFPQSARIRFYRALQLRYEKKYDDALACLAQVRALAVGPEASVMDPGFYLETVQDLSLAGKENLIEATLHEALTKYPENADLMNELAYFWADHGQHLPEALALGKRAAQLDPENGPIQDTCGWVYFKMGQVKDALPYLQRAALMTNNDPVVLQHVGDACLKLGLRREAIATWSRALGKDPHNGDLANRINAAQAQAKNAHLRSAPNP